MLISVCFITQVTEGHKSRQAAHSALIFIVLLRTFNHNILYNFNIKQNQIMDLGRFYVTKSSSQLQNVSKSFRFLQIKQDFLSGRLPKPSVDFACVHNNVTLAGN